jgi:hypothetical protein
MYAAKKLLKSMGSEMLEGRQTGLSYDVSNLAAVNFNSTIAGIEEADVILLVSTNPPYSGRVQVTRRESLTSAVVQLDPAPGLAGQLAVTITEVGPTAAGAAASQTVSSIPFSNAGPNAQELTAGEVAGCPDLVRSQQHRGLRQMLKNGQVPEHSAEAAQFWAPQGVVPNQTDAYGVPFASQGGQDWGRWR